MWRDAGSGSGHGPRDDDDAGEQIGLAFVADHGPYVAPVSPVRRAPPCPVDGRLSNEAVFVAAVCGVVRNYRAHVMGRPQANGHPAERDWTDHIHGVIAETFTADDMGLAHWVASLDPDTASGDVGGWQCKSTLYRHGHLTVSRRNGQPAGHRYVLVIGIDGGFAQWRIAGWITGEEILAHDATAAPADRWWRCLTAGRPPCYCVPQMALHPWHTRPA